MLYALLLAAAQLKTGRYLGYLALDGQDKKLGAVFDTYVVQPNDLTQFPRQNAILKLTLGGFAGREYESQVYEAVRYDYDNGVLSLDGAGEDVVVTADVAGTEAGGVTIDGPVFVRSAGVGGRLHLELLSDEGGSGAVLPPEQYVSELHGQYRGHCGDARYSTLLQIETARGLEVAADGERHGLFDYTIKGRVGVRDEVGCGSTQLWCDQRNYTDGSYDYLLHRLTLTASNGTDECEVTPTGLSCTLKVYPEGADHCDFTREPTDVPAAAFSERGYFLRTTPAQRAKLPDPDPPRNAALIEALRGTFTGNLFHEASGQYQTLQLNVMASSSTDNPHNENLVYVTATSMLHFGPGGALSRDFWTQPFEPRSFYLAPGFTLESPSSDAFLQIVDWRVGYIRGVWLSHAFGRVGTFELVKGTDPQPPPAEVPWVASLLGAFSGEQWWLKLLVPVQQPRAEVSTAGFVGETELSGANLPRQGIAKGAYDFYSGSLAWLGSDGRLITGRVKDADTLALWWGPAPIWGVILDDDHGNHTYRREP
jgi:hypothetical protein